MSDCQSKLIARLLGCALIGAVGCSSEHDIAPYPCEGTPTQNWSLLAEGDMSVELEEAAAVLVGLDNTWDIEVQCFGDPQASSATIAFSEIAREKIDVYLEDDNCDQLAKSELVATLTTAFVPTIDSVTIPVEARLDDSNPVVWLSGRADLLSVPDGYVSVDIWVSIDLDGSFSGLELGFAEPVETDDGEAGESSQTQELKICELVLVSPPAK